MLDFNLTLIIIVASFMIFAYVMHNIFYVPMRRVMQERELFVNNNINESHKTNKDADNVLSEYNDHLKEAKIQAYENIEMIKAEGVKIKNNLITQSTEKAEKQISEAKEEIVKQKEQAVSDLHDNVVPLAQQIVAKLLGSSISISGIDNEKVNKMLKG